MHQNLRTIRAGTALFPHASAEVSLAEAQVMADTQSRSSQPGRSPSPHLHPRRGAADLQPVGRAVIGRAYLKIKSHLFRIRAICHAISGSYFTIANRKLTY